MERLTRLESEVGYLKERDLALNGSIQRTEKKVDGINSKFSQILGGVLVGVILAAVQLALRLAERG